MKHRAVVYCSIGLIQIAAGLLGSYFVFVVSGVLMFFKGFTISKINNRVLKTLIGILFGVLNAYFIYYSFFMLLSELDYASLRPQIWICIPIAVSFIAFLGMLIFARDNNDAGDTIATFHPTYELDLAFEDMTVFILILIGWLGTFFFEFYFEYAAAACMVACSFKNLSEVLYPNKSKLSDIDSFIEEISTESQTQL